MSKITADIIVGLQYGDEGKGKVVHSLLRDNEYTHCIRYNGGCNAGHTIYHEGKKLVTHHIPAGVLYGIKSIIGPGCVLDLEQFLSEIEMLDSNGIRTDGLIFVDKRVHIIQSHHKSEDSRDVIIGTTKRGNGQAYRDKYARAGIRFGERHRFLNKNLVTALEGFDIDLYEEFHNNDNDVQVLCEGAQGFGLDIDWGDYPFVTSSHCTSASALLNCIPWNAVRDVYGVAKTYETYVGAKQFQPKNDVVFESLQQFGSEFGATTGRVRQCNWIDLDFLKKSCKINGVTVLIVNKYDIIKQVLPICYYEDNKKIEFDSAIDFRKAIVEALNEIGVGKVLFSSSPYNI